MDLGLFPILIYKIFWKIFRKVLTDLKVEYIIILVKYINILNLFSNLIICMEVLHE